MENNTSCQTKIECDIVNTDLCDHYFYSKRGCNYKKTHAVKCPFDNQNTYDSSHTTVKQEDSN